MSSTSSNRNVAFVLPVFNDWESCWKLLENIDRALGRDSVRLSVYIIDDGSSESAGRPFPQENLSCIESVKVLRLRRNLGHQRAIAVGLSYLNDNNHNGPVVIMDADGEDSPDDLPSLLAAFETDEGMVAVFAERRRRSENLRFRSMYFCYRHVHFALTGVRVRVGNFSIIPHFFLSALTVAPELWSHYAATVIKLRLPMRSIPTKRGMRYFGKTRMNFISLVIHGLSAISVFGEIAAIRLLVLSATLAFASTALLIGLIVSWLFSDSTVPVWAPLSVGIILLHMGQIIAIGTISFLSLLNQRSTAISVPLRDYALYIERVERL